MMQLYNALTILPIMVPANVLEVQSNYNGIINMEFIPNNLLQDIIDFLLFWRDPVEKTENDTEEAARRLQDEETTTEDEVEEQTTQEQEQEQEENTEDAPILEPMSRDELVMIRLDIQPQNPLYKLKGVIFASLALIFIFILLGIVTLNKCIKRLPARLTKINLKLKELLMYNSILRYTQQIFFSITLSSMLNLNYAAKNGF